MARTFEATWTRSCKPGPGLLRRVRVLHEKDAYSNRVRNSWNTQGRKHLGSAPVKARYMRAGGLEAARSRERGHESFLEVRIAEHCNGYGNFSWSCLLTYMEYKVS